MKKTLIATAVLTFVTVGIAAAQDPAVKPDTAKARAGWDSTNKEAYPATPGQQAQVDINTASKAQLEAAGFGPYADKIIAGRPFKSANELVDKNIVPEAAWKSLSGKAKVGAM